MLHQLPRYHRAQGNPEQDQHGLGQDRRHGEWASGNRGNADGDHGARNQTARQVRPMEQRPTAGADDQGFEHVERPGTGRDGKCHRNGDQAHDALWQIRSRGTNAPARCSNAHPRTLAYALALIPRMRADIRLLSSGSRDSRNAGYPTVVEEGSAGARTWASGLRLRSGAFSAALAFGHEFLALLAMAALGFGFL